MGKLSRAVKRSWRKTGARRVLRGLLGPKRGVLIGYIKNKYAISSHQVNNSGGFTLMKTLKSDNRIATKYALDALNVTGQHARKKTYALMENLVRQAIVGEAHGRTGLSTVQLENLYTELTLIMRGKAALFLAIFKIKLDRIVAETTL